MSKAVIDISARQSEQESALPIAAIAGPEKPLDAECVIGRMSSRRGAAWAFSRVPSLRGTMAGCWPRSTASSSTIICRWTNCSRSSGACAFRGCFDPTGNTQASKEHST